MSTGVQEFHELMGKWETFYLLTGTAGAVLAGLMFVAVTFTERLATPQGMPLMRAHNDPILLSFTLNIVLSALFLMPNLSPFIFSAALTLLGVVSVVYTLSVLRGQILAGMLKAWDRSDKFWYGATPLISALLLLLGGVLGLWQRFELALPWSAFALVFLLVVGTRNAWDLVTFSIVRRPQNPEE